MVDLAERPVPGLQASPPVIPTKLIPPLAPSDVLARPRLAELAAAVRANRLTAICAPAGYGKSLFLSALAGPDTVWYSLGRSDRDRSIFLAHLLAGLRRTRPALLEGFADDIAFTVGGHWQLESFIARLGDRLLRDPAGSDLLLALDDFHVVADCAPVALAVDELLRYLPRSVRFVIASRSGLRLPAIPKLRGSGHVLEISAEDLRLTTQEAEALLGEVHRLDLAPAAVAALVDEAEGWPIALQLAGRAIKGMGHRPDGRGAMPASAEGALSQFLAEEVYRAQPSEVQAFLADTSIFSCFNAAVCDAVLERDDSAPLIEYLEEQNLFLVRIDRHWVRYHQLFRRFLGRELARQDERRRAFHRRAAEYFQSEAHQEEAVHHFLAAREHGKAARLITRIADQLLRTSRFDTLANWIGQLPDQILLEFPDLLERQARLHELRGYWDAALEWYDRAAKVYLERSELAGLSQVLCSKSYILEWRRGEHQKAESLQREAMTYLGAASRRERAAILAKLAFSEASDGDTGSAEKLCEEALSIYDAEADKEGELATLLNPAAWIYFVRGEFNRAVALLHRAKLLAQELGSTHHLARCYCDLASNLHYLGRIGEARELAEEALTLSRRVGAVDTEALACLAIGKALQASPHPDYDRALKYYQQAFALAEAARNLRLMVMIVGWQLTLHRHRGERDAIAALRWKALDLAGQSTDRHLFGFILTNLGSALIGLDAPAAAQLLSHAEKIQARCRNQFNRCRSHFWLARLYGPPHLPEFRVHLAACLDIASQHGYDPFFTQERADAIPLLVAALEHDLNSPYAARLLVRFGADAVDHLQGLLNRASSALRPQVIRLLAEIGQETCIFSIRQCLRDRDVSVRVAANEALLKLQARTVARLRVHLLGEFKVYRGETLIRDEEWRRKKVRNLFKYLVANRQRWVSRDVLLELFWSDMDPEAALNNLRVTISSLRRVIEPGLVEGQQSHYILSSGDHYRFNPAGDFWLDVEAFEERAREGSEPDDEQAARWEDAVRLYQGDYLEEDVYEDWTAVERERLLQIYLELLARLARDWASKQAFDRAIDYCRRIIAKDPCHEEAHRELMRYYFAAGRRTDALRQFEQCVSSLERELRVAPMDATVQLYRQILSSA